MKLDDVRAPPHLAIGSDIAGASKVRVDARPADLVFDPTSACRGARGARVRIFATTDLLSDDGRLGRRRGRTYS